MIYGKQETVNLIAQIIVVAFFFLANVLLLALIPTQTRWINGAAFVSQPSFWSIIAISIMIVFSLLFFLLHIKRILSHVRTFQFSWKKDFINLLEYSAWFLTYVLAVPYLGYLLCTILFMVSLSLRKGYRSKKMIFSAALCALIIVVFFKSIMQVKIPGGLIYQYLPTDLQIFFITYL